MKKMKKESIKLLLWGVGIGALVLLIVIFATGWVMTSSSAETKAKEMADKAVVDRLVEICVAQFKQDPEKDKKIKQMEEKNSYERDDYVKEQGWATMPGEKEPDSNVADECAKRIMELKQ